MIKYYVAQCAKLFGVIMYFIATKQFIQAAFVALISIMGTTLAMADGKGRYITVSGKGEVSAAPDTAWISSGVNTQAKTAADALEENNQLMGEVIEVFLDADIEEKNIQTSGFNVHPVYDYSRDNKPPKLAGYQVTNNVTVKVTDLKKLGDLLDDVVESGSNQISGIRFGFADDEALLDQARKAAIANAKKKAKLYADAADVDVGDVISISEMGIRAPQPVYHRAEMAAQSKMMDSSVPVMGGEQEISASVTVVYELED